MANKKTSELPILSKEDIKSSDMFVVLDKTDTTGPGAGPGGALKQTPADSIIPFHSQKGKINDLNLTGIDTEKDILIWAAEAINANGPFECIPGDDFLFRTQEVLSSELIESEGSFAQIEITYRTTFFKIISGALKVGGSAFPVGAGDVMIAGGPYVKKENNPNLFLEIGDAGTLAIHLYFNMGKNQNPSGAPWVITTEKFLTGRQNGKSAIWYFKPGPGSYGGGSGQITTALDFINLSEQNEEVGTSKPFHRQFISLENTDTQLDRLSRVAQAIREILPITTTPGQLMEFYTLEPYGAGFSYRMNSYALNFNFSGEVGVRGLNSSDIIPLGSVSLNPEDEDENSLKIDLGDIRDTPIHEAFNEGNLVDGQYLPWRVKTLLFVTATQYLNGENKLRRYVFNGKPGLYGGEELGIDLDILEAFPENFIDISDNPVVPPDEESRPTALKVPNFAALSTLPVAKLEQYVTRVYVVAEQKEYRFIGTDQNLLNAWEVMNVRGEITTNKKQDLTSTDTAHYPSVPAVKAGIADAVKNKHLYITASFTLKPEHNNAVIFLNGTDLTVTIDPTESYPKNFEVYFVNRHFTPVNFIWDNMSGWTKDSVNDVLISKDSCGLFRVADTNTLMLIGNSMNSEIIPDND